MVCERMSKRALVRAEICNSLNVHGKRGRHRITIIILFYLMHITCATIIASRGLSLLLSVGQCELVGERLVVVALLIEVVGPDHSRPVWAELCH